MSIDPAAGETGFPPTPSHYGMPTWYPELLDSVAARINTGRQRAVATVNSELVLTYWAIGRDILDRQEQEGWGAKVIDRLSADLRERFPDAKGYSTRNLKYMRAFAAAWPDPAIVQRSAAQLPWRQHQVLLDKLDRPDQRLWYAGEAISNGWSRDILVLQIDRRLHERTGKAITNLAATMPPEDSDMAQQSIKDPYIFDFLDLTERSRERDVETGLVDHIGKFLLELGQGFAFVGRQVRLEVDGDEFYCDLLFYHLRLRRYVVIELKSVRFEPGFLGQLGMYMAAVDDLLAHKDDEPTIGLMLCRGKNNVVAEWALRGYKTPIGVADWTNAITTALPDDIASNLPSIEEIEAELSDPGIDDAD